VGAAFTSRRVLQPLEARLIFIAGLLLLGIAAFLYFFPQVAGYALMAVFGWIGLALICRAWKLYRKRNSSA
jgi:cardiolipin synthase